MATTSFRKKTVSPRHQQHPKGTRPSLHNAQLLVSTGVASLDALLGIVRLPDTHGLCQLMLTLQEEAWLLGLSF